MNDQSCSLFQVFSFLEKEKKNEKEKEVILLLASLLKPFFDTFACFINIELTHNEHIMNSNFLICVIVWDIADVSFLRYLLKENEEGS